MSISLLTHKPIILGLQHFGIGLLSLGAISGVGAGAVQVAGDPNDSNPKVEIMVPKINPAPASHGQSVKDISNTQEIERGFKAFIPWGRVDGAMSPWIQGATATQTASLGAEVPVHAAPEPRVTSAIEAASAPPSQHASGNVRILSPQMGNGISYTTTENGVTVTRSGSKSSSPLITAPISGVSQQGPNGILPVIGADGRTPFNVYKRPDASSGNKVALVIGGLGLNARITERAINNLPAEVTLSFVPYSDNLQGWINKARAAGHEVLIEVPLEPHDYPQNDTGPHTLMSNGTPEENKRRLEFLLSRASGYFGVLNYMGAKFATSASANNAFMGALKSRGLGFISDGSSGGLGQAAQSIGLNSATADRAIDQRPAAQDITAQLGALEAMATQKGAALGFGVGYSVTIDQIVAWADGAKARGINLAPASAVAN